MEFNDGDRIEGQYGTAWTRRDGEWYTENSTAPSNDDTMEYLLGLNNLVWPQVEQKISNKISKSTKYTEPGFRYKFKLIRGNNG